MLSQDFRLKPLLRRRRRRRPPSLRDRADFPQTRNAEREGEAVGRAAASFLWGVRNLDAPHSPGPRWMMRRVALEKWGGSVDLGQF